MKQITNKEYEEWQKYNYSTLFNYSSDSRL